LELLVVGDHVHVDVWVPDPGCPPSAPRHPQDDVLDASEEAHDAAYDEALEAADPLASDRHLVGLSFFVDSAACDDEKRR
jgi:hypothetical protein